VISGAFSGGLTGMMHALVFGLVATLAYAGLYLLLGWANTLVTHHYYEIAHQPELASPAKTAAVWLLKAALLYVLLGWMAELAAVARVMVHGWPLPLALLGYTAVLLLACGVLLLMVWAAFKVQAHFNVITPEFMIAMALCGYEIFAMLPRTRWPWHWLPVL
jgi:hypothetical protein